MNAVEIKKDLYWTGVLDPNLKVFDIIMETKYGSSYNSYLLKGSEKTALFETCKLKFFDEMKAYIESQTRIEDIDYLIMDHTEPDHAGTVEKLLEINPGLTIVATGTALQFLKHIVNADFNSIAVKEGDSISLGDKTLNFKILPFLHWPDTMYTWVPEIKALFTCDSFGSHYACDGVLRSKVTDEAGYADATKYYFDCILKPFAYPYMYNALEAIKDLDIETICCGHGPVLDSHFDELFGWYRSWCTPPDKTGKKLVVMPYVSAYGYTKQLSEEIEKGVTAAGEGNIEVRRYDLIVDDTAGLKADIEKADGYLFGTPTILGEALEPIWELTLGMYPPVFKGRLASAFGSYGWSGEGVPHLIERLKQIRLKVVDGFRVRFKPDENQLTDAYDFGYNFGCTLLKKEPKKQGARTLVKCLVCGAIFDSSMQVCPVCGVGSENFVPAEEESGFTQDSDRKYLILGGGIAGLEAAKAIRKRDKTGSITMISEEHHVPYNRPLLTKSLLSELTEKQLYVEPRSWFEENNINIVLGATVTSIDASAKTVSVREGSGSFDLIYDKLIYALGAHSFMLPFKGAETNNVFAIRTIEDVEGIQSLIPNVKEAVVIGGGVLGLETAWSLLRGKIKVSVVEHMPKIMERQLTPEASDMLQATAEDAGARVYTSSDVAEITIDGVTLTDGTHIPAQLIIVSIGVRSNLDQAKNAGIEIGRCIKVNEKMETNLPDVYAAGDCAEFNGVNYALWSQSVEQGKTAGANAAGDEAVYESVDGALTFNGMNTSLFSIGDNGVCQDKTYRTILLKDEKRHQYEKYTFENNRLVGVILIGNTKRLAELSQAVKDHVRYADMKLS